LNCLRHFISEECYRPDPAEVDVIERFLRLENEKRLRSFLRMIGYYRRFIPRFSTVAAPMHALLRKDAEF
jgi:hypothetical protein